MTRARLGRPSVPHATAVGKVLLAFDRGRALPPAPLRHYTERTLVDPDALARQLVTVRRRGWADAAGERDRDLNAIAAPVFARDGALAAIVGVQGPAGAAHAHADAGRARAAARGRGAADGRARRHRRLSGARRHRSRGEPRSAASGRHCIASAAALSCRAYSASVLRNTQDPEGSRARTAPLRFRRRDRRRRPRPLDRLASRPRRDHRRRRPRQVAAIASGASGIACGVVRNNYFQPAMSDLMAACVEIWESQPERPALPRQRLHRARLREPGGRPDGRARAPRAPRLRLDARDRRGRGARAHARALPRLAGGRPRGLPARAPRRLRLQQGVDARPRRARPRRRRHDHRGRRGHRLRARRRRRGDRRADLRRDDRDRAGRRRRRPMDREAVVDARAARPPRRPPARRQRARATSRCGPTGTSRRARSTSRRRSS